MSLDFDAEKGHITTFMGTDDPHQATIEFLERCGVPGLTPVMSPALAEHETCEFWTLLHQGRPVGMATFSSTPNGEIGEFWKEDIETPLVPLRVACDGVAILPEFRGRGGSDLLRYLFLLYCRKRVEQVEDYLESLGAEIIPRVSLTLQCDGVTREGERFCQILEDEFHDLFER